MHCGKFPEWIFLCVFCGLEGVPSSCSYRQIDFGIESSMYKGFPGALVGMTVYLRAKESSTG